MGVGRNNNDTVGSIHPKHSTTIVFRKVVPERDGQFPFFSIVLQIWVET